MYNDSNKAMISGSSIVHNQAIGGACSDGGNGQGGGFYNAGTAALMEIIIEHNQAEGGGADASGPASNGGDGLGGGVYNPVEADAKWKGKTVDVVMSLRDLAIAGGGDVAVAALVTPSTWPWDARPGWQPASFLFRGRSSEQLMGLQKLDGGIIVRGLCKGLVRGRVTFDDCEIVHKPDAPPAQKPEGPSRAEFDPNELKPTIRWASKSLAELSQDADNGLRYRTALNKLDEEVRAHADKKVRWSLRVLSITETSVVLEGKFKHANPRENRFVGAMAWPCLVLHEGIETKTLALKVGRGISVDRAARLRPDEMLTVVGQVAKVTVMRGGVEEKGSDYPEPDVRITLRDLHAE